MAVGGLRLFQTTENRQAASSFTCLSRGLAASVRAQEGRQELEYSLTWREVSDPYRRASRAVNRHKGHSLKSALRHTVQLQFDGSSAWPGMTGSLRLVNELAGLGPSDPALVRHLRQQAQVRLSLPLGSSGALLQLGAELGFLTALGFRGASTSTHICDRFALGGMPSLRGFSAGCVGPADIRRSAQAQGVRTGAEAETAATAPAGASEGGAPARLGSTHDALGCDAVFNAQAAVQFPLPVQSLREQGLMGQVFANAATGVLLGPGRSMGDAIDEARMRASVGAGLLLPTGLGNLEVNYCHVLKREALDKLSGRIQIGLSGGDTV